MQEDSRINLSKLKKCNRLYSDMIPSREGRICQSCSKNIVDFTKKTNREIALIHLQSNEFVCGYYSKSQRENSINFSVKGRNPSSRWTFAGLFAMMTFQPILTMATSTDKVEQFDATIENDESQYQLVADSAELDERVIIRGVARALNDKKKYENIPFANIVVKGTTIGATTDINGAYTLDVTDYIDSLNSVTLVFSFIGYSKVEKSIDVSNSHVLNFDLTEKEAVNVTAFYVEVKPIPLHKKIWYFIRRPFRRNR